MILKYEMLFKQFFALLAGGILGFIIPIQHFLLITAGVVIGDLITGVIAAKRRGEVIKSGGFKRTGEKLTVYYVGLLASHGMNLAFDLNYYLTYVIAFVICMTEFKSLIENIEDITDVKLSKYIRNIFSSGLKNKI
jgi:hypothetical protein